MWQHCAPGECQIILQDADRFISRALCVNSPSLVAKSQSKDPDQNAITRAHEITERDYIYHMKGIRRVKLDLTPTTSPD